MAEYEITLTGEDIPAQLNKLCAIEPGVYGKRWNPDGSLTVMIRSERGSTDLLAALEQAEERPAAPKPDEAPKPRTPRRSLEHSEGTED